MAEPKLNIKVGDDTFVFWPDRVDGPLARLCRAETTLSPAGAYQQLRRGEADIDTIQILIWCAQRQAGKVVGFLDVEKQFRTFGAMPGFELDFEIVDHNLQESDPET